MSICWAWAWLKTCLRTRGLATLWKTAVATRGTCNEQIRRNELIEGYSVDDFLGLSNEQLDQFVFCGDPIVFRVGSAEILGSFARSPDERSFFHIVRGMKIAGETNG